MPKLITSFVRCILLWMPFVNQYDWWKMSAWVVPGLNNEIVCTCCISIIFVFVLHFIVVQIISIFFLYSDISSRSSSTGGMKTEPLMKGN